MKLIQTVVLLVFIIGVATVVFVTTDAPVPAPTVATLALVGLALVVLGLSRRKRTVHIQIS